VDRLSLKIRDPKARAEVEDNFRKTVGQLLGGATVLIGTAIYALEGVMNTSEQYHQPVLEALCAFVRDRARELGPRVTAIQAALTVIGRRSGGTGLVDLVDAHIPKARLFNLKLSRANLSGADLTGAAVSQTQLDEACGAEAKLPPGLNLKLCDSPK
jgi:hypothetical protein